MSTIFVKERCTSTTRTRSPYLYLIQMIKAWTHKQILRQIPVTDEDWSRSIWTPVVGDSSVNDIPSTNSVRNGLPLSAQFPQNEHEWSILHPIQRQWAPHSTTPRIISLINAETNRVGDGGTEPMLVGVYKAKMSAELQNIYKYRRRRLLWGWQNLNPKFRKILQALQTCNEMFYRYLLHLWVYNFFLTEKTDWKMHRGRITHQSPLNPISPHPYAQVSSNVLLRVATIFLHLSLLFPTSSPWLLSALSF